MVADTLWPVGERRWGFRARAGRPTHTRHPSFTRPSDTFSAALKRPAPLGPRTHSCTQLRAHPVCQGGVHAIPRKLSAPRKPGIWAGPKM